MASRKWRGEEPWTNREPERDPSPLQAPDLLGDEGGLAHARSPLNPDRRTRVLREFRQPMEFLPAAQERPRGNGQLRRQHRHEPRLLMQDRSAFGGQPVHELLSLTASHQAPVGLQPPLLDQGVQRAGHRARVVAERLGELPLGDPEHPLVSGVGPHVVEDLGVDVGLDGHCPGIGRSDYISLFCTK